MKVTIRLENDVSKIEPNKKYECTILLDAHDYQSVYGISLTSERITQKAELLTSSSEQGALHIFIDEETPALWKDISKAQRNSEYLLSKVRIDGKNQTAAVSFDPVKFVRVSQVTNDGIIKYAKTSVELALGLIGIMALWLGIMKIADQSGLVTKLASLLKPVTTQLFPDVPADHPAMGAMIMNISSNMLGLANAATPFGLKAMEELNKLNKKVGTATDAMCTFLVINTSSVQLIPATVIAIRAASGSSNPTEILGPVILATTVNTAVGIIVVKILSRLRIFKKQLEVEG
ncbi:MAG: hypothetical protein HYZ34_08540 [Ignavibacteriae bacterium]|nr:hypothetical protein [Ignavibacteriota bacterium]